MAVTDGGVPPILAPAFTPENLLREACRQKRIAFSRVPEICAIEPDRDIVRILLVRGEAQLESDDALQLIAIAVDHLRSRFPP